MTITLIERHLQYWKEFDQAGKVHYVPGGVDLSRYIPVPKVGVKGDPFPFSARPAIMYAEQWRDIKLPFTLFFAGKIAWRRIPSLRLEIFNVPSGRSNYNPARHLGFFWQTISAKMNVDMICDSWQEGKVTSIEKYYRGAHIYASPCWKGDISRCGMESLACIVPGTEIICNSRLQAIEKVQVGTRVLTHDGKYEPVTDLYERPYSGDIVELTPHLLNETVRLTPEHPVLGIRGTRCLIHSPHLGMHRCKPTCREKDSGHCKAMPFNSYRLEWIPAGELTHMDWIVFPILQDTRDVKEIDLSPFTLRSSTYKWEPETISTDENFFRLLGYFLAEGSATRGRVSFSFGSDETEYIADVVNILRAMKLSPKLATVGKCTTVKVYSSILRRLFSSWFAPGGKESTYANRKAMPQWFLTLPRSKQRMLVRGIFRGDGSIFISRGKYPVIRYSTASKILAVQVVSMLARLGFVPAFKKGIQPASSITKGGNVIQHLKGGRPIYEVKLQGDQCSQLSGIFSRSISEARKGKNRPNLGWNDGKYLYVPIRQISREYYSGKVHNLGVADSNSYLASLTTVHNCGTSVLALNGPGAASMKCRDDPKDMADAIEELWDRIKADPEKEAADARMIAEENYDIRETAKKTVELYRKRFG